VTPHIYCELGGAINANGVIFLCMSCVYSDVSNGLLSLKKNFVILDINVQ